jgi:hypothetical protein
VGMSVEPPEVGRVGVCQASCARSLSDGQAFCRGFVSAHVGRAASLQQSPWSRVI